MMIDRHVIVTGASRGIGEAIASRLLADGYRVSGCARTASAFSKSLEQHGNGFWGTLDLAAPARFADVVAEAEARLGPIFGLVNCAGVAADGLFATMPAQAIEHVVRVNLEGTLLFTREVVRRMALRAGGGSIVTVSSITGQRGYRGLVAYGATKAALDGMTRGLARELGERDIRVNIVAPGFVETEMSKTLDVSQREQIVRRTPLARLATGADVAGAVAFLMSDDAAFITGQQLTVDGGASI